MSSNAFDTLRWNPRDVTAAEWDLAASAAAEEDAKKRAEEKAATKAKDKEDKAVDKALKEARRRRDKAIRKSRKKLVLAAQDPGNFWSEDAEEELREAMARRALLNRVAAAERRGDEDELARISDTVRGLSPAERDRFFISEEARRGVLPYPPPP